MFEDARGLDEGARLEADVCVIGAGAAGITIARELSRSRLRVLLLESGGFEPDAETQDLYDGTSVGVPYYDLDVCRLRFFGGTTNHWTGVSRPLDPTDFERRTWIPHSGWPLVRQDLDPYYAGAHRLCGLEDPRYTPDGRSGADAPPLPLAGGPLKNILLMKSDPVRFGRAYRDDIERAERVRALLHANVVEIVTNSAGRRLDHVRVRCLTGREFTVGARAYVLAAGALENARLLLVSDGARPGGVGNGRGLVGRFFMEHLNLVAGVLVPFGSGPPLDFYRDRAGADHIGTWSPRREALEVAEALNARVHLTPSTVRTDVKSVAPGLVEAVVAAETGAFVDDFGRRVTRVARDLDELVIYSYENVFHRPETERTAVHLNCHIENAPDPDSQVRLGPDRDALGLPRLELDWRFGELERRTVSRLVDWSAAEAGRLGVGRVRGVLDEGGPDGWKERVRGAWHQMGTTRMADSPSEGVVDRHCRVHEVSNLYVAGSSVFPTSGHANPTLTIVALALRLVDRLRTVLE